MTPLVVAEVVLALIVLVIVGALTFVWARRRYISGRVIGGAWVWRG